MSDSQRRLGGRYELLARLSSGPRGAVWCGRDLRSGTDCAVRVLEPGLAADPGSAGEFLDVLGQVGQLGHPDVVAVDDVVSDEGCSALVTRLVSGESLHTRVARAGALERAEAVSLAAQLCAVLADAHAAGLAHGRVKPSNVLLVPGAEAALTVQLTDLGLSGLGRRMVSAKPQRTSAQIAAACYRAPELEDAVRSKPTPAADVYAVGVLLYEALAGRPPFFGTTVAEVGRQHREALPQRLSDLPDPVWPLVLSCLAKEPHLRPEAGDLASLLRGIEAGLPAKAAALDVFVQRDPVLAEPPLAESSVFAAAVPGPIALGAAPVRAALESGAPKAAAADASHPEETVVLAGSDLRPHTGLRSGRAQIALAASVAALVGGLVYMVGGHTGLPAVGSNLLPDTGSGAQGVTRTTAAAGIGTGVVATGTAAATGAASTAPVGFGTSASPSTGTGSPSAGAPAAGGGTTPAAPPPASSAPASNPTTAAPTTPAPSTSTGGTGGSGSGGLVSNPIGYLEGLRMQIVGLVAMGPSVIDANAGGDLENLVLDLENSVTAYQQNGGAAHLQEIKNKMSLFDQRLSLDVSQGRLSQSAATYLAGYLKGLTP
jgi:serine/threonine-protein kinase